jgi:threonine aldolase
MISLGSDNHSGVHPEILASLTATNQKHAPSYGTDDVTQETLQLFKKVFGPECEAYFVFNGTAANVVALSALVKSYQSVICAETSHLQQDECGAPEKHLGCKLITLPTTDGKITPEQIQAKLVRLGDQHHSQPKAVSITQPTEYGTCYSLEELKKIREFTKAHNLYLHIDGARLVQAGQYLNCELSDLTGQLGADAVSFGGTKNGLLFGEVVLVFNKKLAQDLKFIRKQFMQLPSKHRFVAAQFKTLLSGADPLWRRITRHCHKMALELEAGLKNIPQVIVTQKVQANSVFVKFPKEWTSPIRDKYFFYIWDEKTWEARLMVSYDVESHHIQDFIALARKLSQNG